MPRVCFPVGWSSLRTTETSAPRATSLRFRPSMELTPFRPSSKTSCWLHITIIHGDNKIIPASGQSVYMAVQLPGCLSRSEEVFQCELNQTRGDRGLGDHT